MNLLVFSNRLSFPCPSKWSLGFSSVLTSSVTIVTKYEKHYEIASPPRCSRFYGLLITSYLHFWLFCLRLSIHHYVKCTRQTGSPANSFNAFKIRNCVTSLKPLKTKLWSWKTASFARQTLSFISAGKGSMFRYDSYSFSAVAHMKMIRTLMDWNWC